MMAPWQIIVATLLAALAGPVRRRVDAPPDQTSKWKAEIMIDALRTASSVMWEIVSIVAAVVILAFVVFGVVAAIDQLLKPRPAAAVQECRP